MSITLASSDRPGTQQHSIEPSGKATASLVLGIASVPGALVPLIGFPLCVIGLVMATKGMRSTSPGLAKAGLVLSIIGAALSTLVFVVAFANGVANH